jgi:hypothetical protein
MPPPLEMLTMLPPPRRWNSGNAPWTQEIDGVQVDPHHLAPQVGRRIAEHRHGTGMLDTETPTDPGVVHQYRKVAQLLRASQHRFGALQRADVGGNGNDRASERGTLRGRFVELVDAPAVRYHRRSCRGESKRRRATDAGAGTGYHHHLVVQIHCTSPSSAHPGLHGNRPRKVATM